MEELSKVRNIEIGSAVRFLGRVKQIDVLRDRVRVEDSKGHTIYVDSSLLVDIDISVNSLYTFVGEIVRKVRNLFHKQAFHKSYHQNTQFQQLGTCVQARAIRRECDIDTKLYEEALLVRRNYLRKI